jgi:hypothetical protein
VKDWAITLTILPILSASLALAEDFKMFGLYLDRLMLELTAQLFSY